MESLQAFRNAVRAHIEDHAIVRMNRYTSWFARGEASLAELRRFTVQFSVFSHLFIEAQLRKCINAADLQSYRASKEILMNELGVAFTKDGTVEGGRFTFRGAHFEWMLAFAQALGLRFEDIGKPRHASRSTMAFCEALLRWYASADISEHTGASHAIEHWAAAGFWKQLLAGLRRIKATRLPDLPLGFWAWHDQIEDLHAQHTDDELACAFVRPGFRPERFLEAGTAMLDAVETFWEGLLEERACAAAV